MVRIHYRWQLQLYPSAELILPSSSSVDTGVKTQSRSNRNRTAALIGTIINSFLSLMALRVSDGYLCFVSREEYETYTKMVRILFLVIFVMSILSQFKKCKGTSELFLMWWYYSYVLCHLETSKWIICRLMGTREAHPIIPLSCMFENVLKQNF